MKHLLFLLILGLSACAPLAPDWQLQKESEAFQFYTRLPPNQKSLPEFKAITRINANLGDVFNLLMDFERHCQWLYACKTSKLLNLDDYSSAALYQVTQLPLLKGRDIIVTARTEYPAKNHIVITMTGAPNYCEGNTLPACNTIEPDRYIRVTEAFGQFQLLAIDDNQTQVTWQQFLDPRGAIPHWLYRANLARVPQKSLHNLKQLLEQNP